VLVIVVGVLRLLALIAARVDFESVGVLLGAVGAIDKFAVTFRLNVPAERIVVLSVGLPEPAAKAGVFRCSAVTTVLVDAAVDWSMEFVDHVKEAAEVAGGEVVADALENVQDLVVGDLAVVVRVGLLEQRCKGLLSGHHLFLLCGRFARFFLLQHAVHENTTATKQSGAGLRGVTPMSVLAETLLLLGALVGVLFRFLLVPASQRWVFVGTGHDVNRLLHQHGGDLIPHRMGHFLRFSVSVEFLDQIFHHGNRVPVKRSLGRFALGAEVVVLLHEGIHLELIP